jgi:hypothetical protein
MRLRSWLRGYARSRKVLGSIPGEVIEFLFQFTEFSYEPR